MSTYRSLDKNICMHFMINEDKVFDEYNKIWEKVSNIIKKKLIVNLHTIKKI